MQKIKAFTLAEIMIVLTLLGILTGILLPVAYHNIPNENVMKFKKAHATLYKVINELVTSDKYYLDGDLGIRPNGTLIDGTHTGDYTYLCETIADVVSTKSVNCSETDTAEHWVWWDLYTGTYPLDVAMANADTDCRENAQAAGAQIVLSDGIVMYDTHPPYTFANGALNGTVTIDSNGFHKSYKTFCVDIDGIATGEDPFGYGIRKDGKILPGARAAEWLKKDIQNKD